MGLFKRNKDNENQTKCEKCGTELHNPERLKKHMKKAMEKVKWSIDKLVSKEKNFKRRR